ncbi:MAG: DUF1015 family protein [Actinomycetota bacterium]
MPELKPFRGLRYADSERLKDLVCPPYDVISGADQNHLHERHPANAVHLERARSHTGRDERNNEVAAVWSRWVSDGVVVRDDVESFYIYRQDFISAEGRRCRVAGVIGALALGPYGAESGVLPHERTMPGPIEERLSLTKALPVNISPIYSIYRGRGELTPYLDSLQNRPTAARFADEHGILHRLWIISTPAECAMITEALRPGPLVIADGHHRYETALAYGEGVGGEGEHRSVMSFCVDADDEDLVVLPYHRALKTNVSGAELERRMAARFPFRPIDNGSDGPAALKDSGADHPFLLRIPGSEALVEVGDEVVVEQVGHRAQAWRDLDVVALHEAILPLVLPEGVDDLRFSKDAEEILRLVESEGWTAGILLRALHPADVVEVARSGERMPQKASYFWPKAPTGMVFRTLG